jgi:putative ABC transport system permease protein
MRFLNIIKVALRALRRSAMRSILTALGIIIGVAAVIAMVSIGNGAKSQVEASIASLGQNIISVFPGNFTTGGVRGGWGSASTLTVEDAQAISREIAGVVAVSPEITDRNQVLANGLNWNTVIRGEDITYLDIRIWSIASGEMFSEADVRSATKVCVIGQTVANQLFPNMDPVGQTLRIRNIPFKILGVLASKGFNYFGQDQDDTLIIPYSSHLKRIARRPNLNSILIQAQSPEQMARIQQDVTDLLQQRRNGREPDFTVRNQQELAEAATATTKTMTFLLTVIAIISLIVGGIGIMNIMLVSVTERTREIGIRLAVGAHGRDVLTQFLVEAIILSVMGGGLGVLTGIGASQVISKVNGWPVLLSTLWIFIAFGVSAVIGIAFGFFPAYKAAQLDPIEALRYE